MAEIPTTSLPLDLVAPAMTARPGVVQNANGPNNLVLPNGVTSSKGLSNYAANGVPRSDFAAMLAQLQPPAGAQPLNPLAPPNALIDASTLPRSPPAPEISTALPTDMTAVTGGLTLLIATDGNPLPLPGNPLPLPQSATAPQSATPALTEADGGALETADPAHPPAPIAPASVELLAASTLAETLSATASLPGKVAAAGGPQTTTGQNGLQPNTAATLTPAVTADPGASGADQSGEFTFTERQQAELAAKLSREQHAEGARQESSKADTGKAAALEFSRIEPNPHMLPLNAARPGGLEAPTPQGLGLTLPADKASWAEPLAERIALMIQKGGNSAELRLNPPHLGRIEVQFTVNGDQASIVLTTASADIRDALQQSLPRLEALLQNSGLQLADSHITDQQSRHADESTPQPPFSPVEDGGEPAPISAPIVVGLIDTYA